MQRLLTLFLVIGIALTSCSRTTPVAPQIQLFPTGPEPTATPSLFQSPVISETGTPVTLVEPALSLTVTPTVTPTISLTVTQTLTPTLATSSILIATQASPQPPLVLTPAPGHSPFMKKDLGPEPCG